MHTFDIFILIQAKGILVYFRQPPLKNEPSPHTSARDLRIFPGHLEGGDMIFSLASPVILDTNDSYNSLNIECIKVFKCIKPS